MKYEYRSIKKRYVYVLVGCLVNVSVGRNNNFDCIYIFYLINVIISKRHNDSVVIELECYLHILSLHLYLNLLIFQQERNQKLKSRASQLDKQISVLISDSVALLKARMSELGIHANNTVDLLAKAKEIVGRHKELQSKASKLQAQVNSIEAEQAVLVKQRTFEITEKYRQLGHIPPDVEITQSIAHDCILKEISATLAHRKRLHAQVGHIQNEIMQMERASEQQKVVTPSVPVATVKPHTVNSKPRKSREHRSRSQEWPDVPDVGKIEEQNPEILAQKILETGRQIEAGKIAKPNVIVNGYTREPERHIDHHRFKFFSITFFY